MARSNSYASIRNIQRRLVQEGLCLDFNERGELAPYGYLGSNHIYDGVQETRAPLSLRIPFAEQSERDQ